MEELTFEHDALTVYWGSRSQKFSHARYFSLLYFFYTNREREFIPKAELMRHIGIDKSSRFLHVILKFKRALGSRFPYRVRCDYKLGYGLEKN